MKKRITESIIRNTAATLNAMEFVEFLDVNKIKYDILDADNILDYNDGMLNVEVSLLPEGESLLFIYGKYE